jgi:hypothetical protein
LCKNTVVIYGPFVHLFTLSVRLFGQAISSCLCFIGIKDLFKECCPVFLASCAASPLVSTLKSQRQSRLVGTNHAKPADVTHNRSHVVDQETVHVYLTRYTQLQSVSTKRCQACRSTLHSKCTQITQRGGSSSNDPYFCSWGFGFK